MNKKTCSKCRELKPVSEFSPRSDQPGQYKSACKPCRRVTNREYKEANKGKGANYYQQNREVIKAKSATYYEQNKEHYKQYNARRYQENKEVYKANARRWRESNPGKRSAIARKYEVSKLGATPSWLTEDDHKWIEWHYKHAKKMEEVTGVKHHVDHIHPLQGEDVCGLHVPWNLQVIPAEENLKKSNKLEI